MRHLHHWRRRLFWRPRRWGPGPMFPRRPFFRPLWSGFGCFLLMLCLLAFMFLVVFGRFFR